MTVFGESDIKMSMRRNLYLYLTLACFFGLITIFIIDGYMGIYDTINLSSGEREEEIEADHWLQDDIYPSIGISQNEKTAFNYELDNRRFSPYSTEVEVSVWHNLEKVHDLMTEQIQVSAFDKVHLEWVVDTTKFIPEEFPTEQSYEYTVVIKRGEIERKVVIHVSPLIKVR